MFSKDPAITKLINITESTSIKQKCLVKTRLLQNLYTLLSLSHYTKTFNDQLTITKLSNITQLTITKQEFSVTS